MYTEELYIDYFEDLAGRVPEINHSPAQPKFWINFEEGSIEELEAALRSKLQFPCLVIDEQMLESNGGSGQKITLQGGFAVLGKYPHKNPEALRALRLSTMRIARKVIAQMKRDTTAAFGQSDILNKVVQIGKIKQRPTPVILNVATGWAVEFEWILADDITFGMDDYS